MTATTISYYDILINDSELNESGFKKFSLPLINGNKKGKSSFMTIWHEDAAKIIYSPFDRSSLPRSLTKVAAQGGKEVKEVEIVIELPKWAEAAGISLEEFLSTPVQQLPASTFVANPFLEFCDKCGGQITFRPNKIKEGGGYGKYWLKMEYSNPDELHICPCTKEERLRELNKRGSVV